MHVKFVRLEKGAFIPTKTHHADAGYDLYSIEDCVITPGMHKIVKTGIGIEVSLSDHRLGHPVMFVCSRSGLAARHGVFVLNAPGVVDYGYQGDISAILFNAGEHPLVIDRGDRVAQLLFMYSAHLASVHPTLVDSFSKVTDRSSKGFGSSGS